MTVYRVLRASLYRRTGILIVVKELSDERTCTGFGVEGRPDLKICYRGGRAIFDPDALSDRRCFFIEPPEFPIEKLVGLRIQSG